MPDTRRSLLDLVADKTVPVGMQCFTADPKLIDVLGKTGFGTSGSTPSTMPFPRALEDMRACESAGLMLLVRMPNLPTARPPAGPWRPAPRR